MRPDHHGVHTQGAGNPPAGHAGRATVAWEDVAFDPEPGQTWIRVTLKPTYTGVHSLYDPLCIEDRGLFLLDVMTPTGTGPGPSDTLVDQLRSHFRPGTVLVADGYNIRCAEIRRDAGIARPPWRVTPFECRWWVTSANA